MKAKKLVSLALTGVMACSMAACSNSSDKTTTTTGAADATTAAEGADATTAAEGADATTAAEGEDTTTAAEGADATTAAGDQVEAPADFKVGVILVGDENEGYTYAHIKGINEMMEALNLSEDQVIFKYNIPESDACYEAAVDLAEQGCSIVVANSFGHESYVLQAAKEYPDVEFCHATGYQAASSGLDNMHNFFTAVYESRYVSGIVAGMKLNEMLEDGSITEAKLGYVGAYSYAEVVSGYTAFFLGVRSVCPDATMEVKYTGSWADQSLEKEAAEALIADGCVLISQHADTTGAPAACQAAGVYDVGYNISMLDVAPDYALTSASINWAPYYTYAVSSVIKGEKFDTDWCQGYADGADCITELNTSAIAEGTEDAVATAEAALIAGTLHVFDTSTFTVDGKTLDTYVNDYGTEFISDGYFHESEFGSAPAFDIRIDGIKELNTVF